MAPPKDGGEEAEDEGIVLLLKTIYEEAFAYQSIKIIKMDDWRLLGAPARPTWRP